MLDMEEPKKIFIDEDLRGTKLRTGHFNRLAQVSASDVSDTLQDPNREVQGISNSYTSKLKTRFYTVTAVCRETDDLASPEREIEFLVRAGL